VNLVAYALIWAGTAVVAVAALRLVWTPKLFARLHFVGLATSLGAPLFIAGVALRTGVWSSAHDVLKVVVIGALVFCTGPAAIIATARAAQRVDERDG
jgi:monovalent cation/proton antiporter MnhG/PhaG subunit